MLKLKKQQVDSLVVVFQDKFINKIANHLEGIQGITFDTREARERLRGEMYYVLSHGFSSEFEVASVIELFELYGIDMNDPNARQVVEHTDLTVPEKLENLWRLATGVEPR